MLEYSTVCEDSVFFICECYLCLSSANVICVCYLLMLFVLVIYECCLHLSSANVVYACHLRMLFVFVICECYLCFCECYIRLSSANVICVFISAIIWVNTVVWLLSSQNFFIDVSIQYCTVCEDSVFVICECYLCLWSANIIRACHLRANVICVCHLRMYFCLSYVNTWMFVHSL
jgi:hypothetical protein